MGILVSWHFKEQLACYTGKWLWVISNIMLLKTVTNKELTILSLNSITFIAMWSLVACAVLIISSVVLWNHVAFC